MYTFRWPLYRVYRAASMIIYSDSTAIICGKSTVIVYQFRYSFIYLETYF